MRLPLVLLTIAALAGGCAAPTEDDDSDSTGSAATGAEAVPSSFDVNDIMSDAFFADVDYATEEQVQAFLENTPHGGGRRSWMADPEARIGDLPPARAIFEAARRHGINPIMLLARMQIESSSVGVEPRLVEYDADHHPIGRKFQWAFGCHKESAQYPNGLDPDVAPLDIQLECGARTMENLYAKARAGTNAFRVGVPRTTQDGVSVTPENHATAALYSYTPVAGTTSNGGNKLVWSITRQYYAHFERTIR